MSDRLVTNYSLRSEVLDFRASLNIRNQFPELTSHRYSLQRTALSVSKRHGINSVNRHATGSVEHTLHGLKLKPLFHGRRPGLQNHRTLSPRSRRFPAHPCYDSWRKRSAWQKGSQYPWRARKSSRTTGVHQTCHARSESRRHEER